MHSVQNILNDLQRLAEPATKTAAAIAPDLGEARSALQQSLAAVTAPPSEKTAAVAGDASAVQSLVKMASDLADADEAAQLKQAQLYGAAAFDGFIQRANVHAAHAPGQYKVAAEHDELTVKIAADLGYAETENALQRLTGPGNTKTAAEQDVQGILDAAEKVAAASEDCFIRGYQEMHKIAEALA